MKKKICFILLLFLSFMFIAGCDIKKPDEINETDSINISIGLLPEIEDNVNYAEYEDIINSIIDKYNLLTEEEKEEIKGFEKVLSYYQNIKALKDISSDIEEIINNGLDSQGSNTGEFIVTYQYDYINKVELDKYVKAIIETSSLTLISQTEEINYDLVICDDTNTNSENIYYSIIVNELEGNLYSLVKDGVSLGYLIRCNGCNLILLDNVLLEVRYDDLLNINVLPNYLFNIFTVTSSEEVLNFNYYNLDNEFYNKVLEVKLEFENKVQPLFDISDLKEKYLITSHDKEIYIYDNNYLVIKYKTDDFYYKYNIIEGSFSFIDEYFINYSFDFESSNINEITVNCKENLKYEYNGACITSEELINNFINSLNNIKLKKARCDYIYISDNTDSYIKDNESFEKKCDYVIKLGYKIIYVYNDIVAVEEMTSSSLKLKVYSIDKNDISFIESYVERVEYGKLIDNKNVALILDKYLGENNFVLNKYDDLELLDSSYKDYIINVVMRDDNLDMNFFDKYAIVYVNLNIPKGVNIDGVYYKLMEYDNKYLEVVFDVDKNNEYNYVYEEDTTLPFLMLVFKQNITKGKLDNLDIKASVNEEFLDYSVYTGKNYNDINNENVLEEGFLLKDSYSKYVITDLVTNKTYDEASGYNIGNDLRGYLSWINYSYYDGNGYCNKDLSEFEVIRTINLNNGEIVIDIIDDITFIYNGELCEVNEDSYKDFSFLDQYFEYDIYSVNLDPNGGSVQTNKVETNYLGNLNLPYPVRDGYLFCGWFDGSSKQIGSGKYTGEETTLTAKWTKEEDWAFELDDFHNKYKITSYLGDDSVIYMPIYKDGKGVYLVDKDCFKDNQFITTVYAPLGMNFYDRSFNNCDSFKEFYIGKSIGGLSGNIFYGCDNLESIVVDEENRTYGGKNVIFNKLQGVVVRAIKTTDLTNLEVKSIGRYAFTDLTGLKSVVIPESCKDISMCAFSDCVDLEEVIILGNITKLDYSTFRGCKSLKEVVLPNSLVEIDDFVFEGCSSLKEVTIPGSVKTVGHYTFKDCSSLEILTLSEGCTSLGIYTLHNCNSLLVLNLPSTLTFIGANVFQGCNNIRTINIGGNKYFEVVDNALVSYGKIVYTMGNKISSDDSVTRLQEYAYYYNLSLTQIEVPSNITIISKGVFNNCRNLEKVILNVGLRDIGSYAFANCHKLTEITIPEGVKSIGYGAFVGSGLTKVYLPKTLQYLDKNAFLGIEDLEIIIDEANPFYEFVDGVLIDTRTNEIALVR